MSDDRPPRSRRPGGGPAKRGGAGRPGGAGRSEGRKAGDGRGSGRPGGGSRSGGSGRRPAGGRDGAGTERPGRPTGPRRAGSGGGRTSRPARGGDRPVRSEPRTEAERRAAEVRATRGPRRTPSTPDSERAKIEARETERWIDEGSLRDEAAAATARAAAGPARRARDENPQIDPEVVSQIQAALDPARAKRLAERLAMASQALDRERFDEARRITYAVAKELPTVAAVHEVHGLACYRMGRWKQAAQSLELARQLRPDPALLPVLADCYRALRRWDDVESVWTSLKGASPSHEVMTEGRIVAAGAQADRGDVKGALQMLLSAEKPPKKVRDHHLRQWYVLADLFDRAGDAVAATRWFQHVASYDAEFADVRERLRALGR